MLKAALSLSMGSLKPTHTQDFGNPVLVSAISDAMQLESPLKYRRNEARDAIRWLVHGGADFEEVCINAGIEHTIFKKAALELLEKRLGRTLLGSVIAQHVLPWA